MRVHRRAFEHNAEMARPFSSGACFSEASAIAASSGRRLITCARAGELIRSGAWVGLEKAFPAWTGTIIAYPAANKAFGVLTDIIDDQYRYCIDTLSFAGRKGTAIVLESGTYELHDESSLRFIVPASPAVEIIFPQADGDVDCGLLSGHVRRSAEGGVFALVRDGSGLIRADALFSKKHGVLVEGAYGSIPPGDHGESYLHESGGD